MGGAAGAARFAVRPLLPGPDEALREAVLSLGGGPEQITMLARHAAVEALAVGGLRADECRILEREARRLGAVVLADGGGSHAVVLGSLIALGELPGRLSDFGRGSEELGEALLDAMARKGSRPRGLDVDGDHLPTGARTHVVAIINVTPDSFSGDGLGPDPVAAAELAVQAVADGADIVEVGGESTRPNAEPVDPEEEMRRVLPAIRAVAAAVTVPVAVDTRRAAVAERAMDAGARIVNDVHGLQGDPGMAAACARGAASVVVMHNGGLTAQTDAADGEDLVGAAVSFLYRSLALAEAAGIPFGRLAVDPGFGFGVTPAQNLDLVRRLGQLRSLGRPIVLGASRKSTIGMLLADPSGNPAPQSRRLEGSLAIAAMGIAMGADIVRVHDVAATVRLARVVDAVVRGTPAGLADVGAPGPTL